ncbi:MAG: acyl-CoA dehydrogenase family protein [Terricaulis sp.]
MDISLTAEDIAFRDEVRAFFAANLTPRFREAGALMTSVYSHPEIARDWQRILHAKGWAAPGWPKADGGAGWTSAQHRIYAEERARAGAPAQSPMGVAMIGPILCHYGTPEQKRKFLPKTLSADIFWCQGYSEPNSGSDLASLQMRAEDAGDDFICTGEKIWTTHAHVADWIFCLVRTAADGRVQQGITFLLIDMHSPGVEVRPIISLSGEHIQNQVFFTNVRVPKENVVGAIGAGWTVAKHLLEFERGGGVAAPSLNRLLSEVRTHARETSDGAGGTLADDPQFRAKIAEAQVAVDAFEALEQRLMFGGGKRPTDPSMLKVKMTELSQHITELAIEAAGNYVQPFQPHAVAAGGPVPGFTPPNDGFAAGEPWHAVAPLKYLNDRAASIYAGSNEIQRNIMARLLL